MELVPRHNVYPYMPPNTAEYMKKYFAKNRAKLAVYKQRWRKGEKLRRNERIPKPTRAEPALCECCGKPPAAKFSLCLDHYHDTGAFRGWICRSCNGGIAILGDTKEGVQNALAYLEMAELLS